MENKECSWKKNNDGQYETSCKEKFEFIYYEDFENTNFKYCPFCGGKIEKVKTKECKVCGDVIGDSPEVDLCEMCWDYEREDLIQQLESE